MNLNFSKKRLSEICKRHNIGYLALFGSQARGEADDESDVDLLVNYTTPTGLLTHAHVQNELQDFLKRDVDLIMTRTLKASLKPYVQRDLVTLYEKR